jgi:uncharacterized protein YegP (UPF0339 family)
MHFSIRENRNGQFYFELVGDDGEIIAISRTYSRKQAAKQTTEAMPYKVDGVDLIDHTGTGDRHDRRLP